MQLETEFVPQSGAGGWQVSNPPILALVPVRASYAIFDEVGMPALVKKSGGLTTYLKLLVREICRLHAESPRLQMIDPQPRDVGRGCQLSLVIHERAREVLTGLEDNGVVADFREPNIIRVAPVPLYNTFHEAWRFAQILKRLL
jgi:kynureninase